LEQERNQLTKSLFDWPNYSKFEDTKGVIRSRNSKDRQ